MREGIGSRSSHTGGSCDYQVAFLRVHEMPLLSLFGAIHCGLEQQEAQQFVISLINFAWKLTFQEPMINTVLGSLQAVSCGISQSPSPLDKISEALGPPLKLAYEGRFGLSLMDPRDQDRFIFPADSTLCLLNWKARDITMHSKQGVRLSTPDCFCAEISCLSKRRISGVEAEIESPFRTDMCKAMGWLTQHLPEHVRNLQVIA